MRLWTLHPEHLDAKGLTALWREALLAKKVLRGLTKGYRHHPQLRRFQATSDPVRHIDAFLRVVHEESLRRGYSFDPRKLGERRACRPIPTTKGQLDFEWAHLRKKVRVRDPRHGRALARVAAPKAHPLFRIVRGPVEEWERGSAG